MLDVEQAAHVLREVHSVRIPLSVEWLERVKTWRGTNELSARILAHDECSDLIEAIWIGHDGFSEILRVEHIHQNVQPAACKKGPCCAS